MYNEEYEADQIKKSCQAILKVLISRMNYAINADDWTLASDYTQAINNQVVTSGRAINAIEDDYNKANSMMLKKVNK